MLVQSNKAAVVEPAVVGEEDWRAAVSSHLAGALLPSQQHEKSDRPAGRCHSFGSPGAR